MDKEKLLEELKAYNPNDHVKQTMDLFGQLMTNAVSSYNSMLESMEAVQKRITPTTGTPVDQKDDRLDDLSKQVTALSKQVETLTKKLSVKK